jgi:hypothetical protein
VHVPECNDFFVGTVLAGGDCYVNQECVSQRCSGETGTSCTLGTCIGDTPPSTTHVALGMPCTTTSSCVDGAYCAADTDLCTALKGSGELCTGSTECGYGFACAGPSGMRTCQPLPALGQPCRLDLPCRDEGHVCNTQTMTCMQLGLVGAPCTSSMQCSPFYRCDTTIGMCAKGPSVNESCSTAARCFDAGNYCDPATVTCVPAKEDGMLCQSDLQCASELCDMTTATAVCASPPICFD